jgi:hypothetical protein
MVSKTAHRPHLHVWLLKRLRLMQALHCMQWKKSTPRPLPRLQRQQQQQQRSSACEAVAQLAGWQTVTV